MPARLTRKSSFNPLNPCDYVHLAGTIPSRAAVAYYSPYAVEAALANMERTQVAQDRRRQINEYRLEAMKARQMGNNSAATIKQYRHAVKAEARAQIDAKLQAVGV